VRFVDYAVIERLLQRTAVMAQVFSGFIDVLKNVLIAKTIRYFLGGIAGYLFASIVPIDDFSIFIDDVHPLKKMWQYIYVVSYAHIVCSFA